MALFAVNVTRDCTFTQTALVEVEAQTKEEAHAKALAEVEECCQSGPNWTDDDDSYHFGEDGAYLADPESTEELAT